MESLKKETDLKKEHDESSEVCQDQFQLQIRSSQGANTHPAMTPGTLHNQTIVTCIWDFDKTLIPGYMQSPLFRQYGIDEETFWREVNALPEHYRKRGQTVSKDTIYLNHLLTYLHHGKMPGLSNAKLRACGRMLTMYPGLPSFFKYLKDLVANLPGNQRYGISLEHYIISTGLAEIIRGCPVAEFVDGIYGCELLENPLPPGYLDQTELGFDTEPEISQIGTIVDNTIKTRYIFEINKGSNKNEAIDVNAAIHPDDRRVPIRNMIYIADGPSDVPVFSVINKGGGKTYAVYNPEQLNEFRQNDRLLQINRINAYGPADYRSSSSTAMWIRMHVLDICDRIMREKEHALSQRVSTPPVHLHADDILIPEQPRPEQTNLID